MCASRSGSVGSIGDTRGGELGHRRIIIRIGGRDVFNNVRRLLGLSRERRFHPKPSLEVTDHRWRHVFVHVWIDEHDAAVVDSFSVPRGG